MIQTTALLKEPKKIKKAMKTHDARKISPIHSSIYSQNSEAPLMIHEVPFVDFSNLVSRWS